MGGCCGKKNDDGGGGDSRQSDSKQYNDDPNANVKGIHNRDQFDNQLQAAGSKLLVADFYAAWCGPCRMVAPKLEEMAGVMTDVKFMKIDMEENEDLATQYGISCMPTFIFFKNGEKVDEFSGPNIEKLKELISLHK